MKKPQDPPKKKNTGKSIIDFTVTDSNISPFQGVTSVQDKSSLRNHIYNNLPFTEMITGNVSGTLTEHVNPFKGMYMTYYGSNETGKREAKNKIRTAFDALRLLYNNDKNNLKYLQDSRNILKKGARSGDPDAISEMAAADLYAKYLEQDKLPFGILKKSSNKPSKSTDKNASYYHIKELEPLIATNIQGLYERYKDKEELYENIDGVKYFKISDPTISPYGVFTMYYDPKSGDVSYYDKYDLDKLPFMDSIGKPFEIYNKFNMKKYKKDYSKPLTYEDRGYVFDDSPGGGEHPKKGINYELLMQGAGVLGNNLYNYSNLPDNSSNETTSAIGMGLQGVSTGSMLGPIGAILGGIGGAGLGWYNAKKRNIEQEELENMKQNAYMANSVREPVRMQEGGDVEGSPYSNSIIKDKNNYIIPQMFGAIKAGGMPLVHLQAEKGEKILMPDGSIFDTNAKERHERMDGDDVTDILPEGSYVASSRKTRPMKKSKAEKVVLGHTPVVYNEFKKGKMPEEIKFSDLFNKEEHSPAELAEIIKKKFKMVDAENDVFTSATNDENKIGRLPYIMNLIASREGLKSQIEGISEPQQGKWGKMVKKVKKYDEGGMSLEELYKQYGEDQKLFNDKYQQQYADYFKYARGANALANLTGIIGTGLQSSAVTPSLRSARYADQMFQSVPNYVREANKSESLSPLYSIARNQGVLSSPLSMSTSRLSSLFGNAINQVNRTNLQFGLDDINKRNQKYQYLQGVEDANLSSQAQAENLQRTRDNLKISQIAGFGGRSLTQDATLKGRELQTKMGLERGGMDQKFNSLSQLAQLRLYQNMMEKMGGNTKTGTDVKSLEDTQKVDTSTIFPDLNSNPSGIGVSMNDINRSSLFPPFSQLPPFNTRQIISTQPYRTRISFKDINRVSR